MLADQVHRSGRVAGAAEQAGGAAHHFHAVVQRQIQAGVTVAPVLHHLRRQAVELVGIDVEPTRVELGALAVGLGAGHAGGVGQHVDDVVELLIFDALVADDADRLRDLARCQVEAGTGRGAAHRIAFGAFALDHHLVQRGRVGGGVGEGGRGQGAECNEYGNGQPLRLRDTEGGTGHGGPGRARALGRHPEGEALRVGNGRAGRPGTTGNERNGNTNYSYLQIMNEVGAHPGRDAAHGVQRSSGSGSRAPSAP